MNICTGSVDLFGCVFNRCLNISCKSKRVKISLVSSWACTQVLGQENETEEVVKCNLVYLARISKLGVSLFLLSFKILLSS